MRLLFVLGICVPAAASNCFDHYNHEAWHGEGLAIVLCRNSPDYAGCQLRRAGGEGLGALQRHGSLDRGRVVFSDYDTLGATYPFALEVVCRTGDGRVDTIPLHNGGQWQDGCCRNREVGACCDEPEPPDAGPRDAGPPLGTPCEGLRARQFEAPVAVLDVMAGSAERLRFEIDGVPDPAGLTGARLAMQLFDADHPGEEGRVYVNGQGPLELPADAGWEDQTVGTTLALPPAMLAEGATVVEFGAGPRQRTHYGVGQLSLRVSGPACERPEAGPPLDAAPPEPDAAVDAATPQADAARVPDGALADAARAPDPDVPPDAKVDDAAPEGAKITGGCQATSSAPAPPLPVVLLVLLCGILIGRGRPLERTSERAGVGRSAERRKTCRQNRVIRPLVGVASKMTSSETPS